MHLLREQVVLHLHFSLNIYFAQYDIIHQGTGLQSLLSLNKQQIVHQGIVCDLHLGTLKIGPFLQVRQELILQ